MNSRNLLSRSGRAFAIMAAAFAFGGCVTAGAVTAVPNPDGTATATVRPTPSDSGERQCFDVDLSKEPDQYSVAGLVHEGMTFVAGRVNTVEPAIYNTLDGKVPRGMGAAHPTDRQVTPMIYTPVVVLVDRVFSGSVKPGANRFMGSRPRVAGKV
jgi:hypothetical protein